MPTLILILSESFINNNNKYSYYQGYQLYLYQTS